MSISLVRLVTGEELVADVAAVTVDGEISPTVPYVLRKPTRILSAPTQSGQVQTALVVATPFGDPDEDITIMGMHILFIMKPNDKVVEAYRRTVSSIVLPPTASAIKLS